MPMGLGRVIVIEGLDHTGKSTQCELLADQLEQLGHCVNRIKFPARDTAIGRIIDDYLKQTRELDDHAIHLLFAANRWELATEIKKSRESGEFVIIDRYTYSGIAFSAAKVRIY